MLHSIDSHLVLALRAILLYSNINDEVESTTELILLFQVEKLGFDKFEMVWNSLLSRLTTITTSVTRNIAVYKTQSKFTR